jgi:hypothetical protein
MAMNRKELRPKALNPKRKVPGWLIAALGIFAVIFCVWAERRSAHYEKQGREELDRSKGLDRQRLAR